MLIRRITLGVLSAMSSFAAYSDAVKIGAVVLDDITSMPMSDVDVCFSFKEDVGWRAWTESSKHQKTYCRTDSKGYCQMTGTSNCGQAGCYVKNPPDGYYHPALGWKNKFANKNLFGVWQPDNLVATIRLQRVEHPIPLFVKNVGDHINRSRVGNWNGTNMVFRYDFVKGDYLPPDGKGEIADVEVDSRVTYLETTNVYHEAKTFFDLTSVISFPGEGNGLIPVITEPTDGIKLRVAPTTGYERAFALKCGTRKQPSGIHLFRKRYSETDPNRCHYFRIRSRFNEKGNLIEAYYGKIYEDFKVSGSLKDGCSVEFLYYLNLNPLDRNLEWDMENNLCPNPSLFRQFQP